MASPATRQAILDAARQLFAEKGYPATSLREITRLAGVNLAAVNYHFGSKEGLLVALLRDCVEPINRARLDRLDAMQAEAGETPLPLETVLHIFLEPVFTSMTKGEAQDLPCLLARMHSEPHPRLHELMLEIMEPVIRRFQDAIRAVLPDLPEGRIVTRGTFMFGAMLHVIDKHRAMPFERWDNEEDLLHELIQFAAAGFRAPVAPATRAPSALAEPPRS